MVELLLFKESFSSWICSTFSKSLASSAVNSSFSRRLSAEEVVEARFNSSTSRDRALQELL